MNYKRIQQHNNPFFLKVSLFELKKGFYNETALVVSIFYFLFSKDWLLVINRDAERQRRMSPQRPYSDAYINGLPKKKRKVCFIKRMPYKNKLILILLNNFLMLLFLNFNLSLSHC